MKYTVIRPFSESGVFLNIGDFVEADNERAARLRLLGLIGGRYQDPIDTAVPKAPMRKAIKKTKK